METQRHADRILRAWELADWSAFRSAVFDATSPSQGFRGVSSLEYEKRELLTSILADLYHGVGETASPFCRSTDAALFLMKHLASVPTQNRLFLVKKNATSY